MSSKAEISRNRRRKSHETSANKTREWKCEIIRSRNIWDFTFCTYLLHFVMSTESCGAVKYCENVIKFTKYANLISTNDERLSTWCNAMPKKFTKSEQRPKTKTKKWRSAGERARAQEQVIVIVQSRWRKWILASDFVPLFFPYIPIRLHITFIRFQNKIKCWRNSWNET